MSDLSKTIHNFEDLITGKTDFSGLVAGEMFLIEKNIAAVPILVQPMLQLAFTSFKAGASALVGTGLTALGPVLAETTDQQATLVLNLMQAAGIPTAGPLSIAEHAALAAAINGLKTGLDRLHLQIAAPVAQPEA